MSRHDDIVSLRELSTDLVSDALRRVRSHREKEPPPDEARFETAEYFLAEALEYVSGAWDAILSKRPKVAVAVSRWIIEASCNVFWVVADEDQVEDRLKKLAAEALRNEANLWGEVAKLWPREKALFLRQAGRARDAREKLGVKDKLPPLQQRLEKAKLPDDLYANYRICCAAAHSGLKAWERFGPDGATGPGSPIDRLVACHMAARSTYFLVVGCYMLTQLEVGDFEVWKSWWKERAEPLLESIEKPLSRSVSEHS